MDVIPAVDVLDGRVVRLRRGSYDDVTVYGDDPVAQAASWLAAGAAMVHLVDLAGARDGTHDVGLWRALGAAGLTFQVGGGIRTAGTARNAVVAGAARVVVGTAAVWEPAVLGEICAAVGAGKVVAAVDVRAGRATGAGWRDEGRSLADVLADVAAAGVVRALVTGIDRDGTMEGPDVALLAEAARLAPGMALIASGGVGALGHLEALAATPVEAVIVGRALYEGAFTIGEALAAGRG
jgi:phosphoribosylformimino-5-aminoimidazole carboxamide ribotide isomerase